MRNTDRFRGCLIGGAAGDALGYTVEFKREKEIFSKYGEKGITEYDPGQGRAQISDDTQMTLFTAAGLMNASARAGARTAGYAGHIRLAYLDWLRTQEECFPPKGGQRHTWLTEVRDLFDRRAPGTTCLSALSSGGAGSIGRPINGSKGCGGVMRVAPVGIYFNDRPEMDTEAVARIGAEAAALTHGNILGWMPAAALVQIVREVSQDDESVRDAVIHALDTAERMWPETGARQMFTGLMNRALDLAAGNTPDLEAIHRLGEGWVAEEALAVAVFCAVRYADDFDRALIAAVNHNGDSDSTGAVTGNILGAKLGLSAIPGKYTDRLELKEVILEIADDLCRDGEDENGRPDPAWTVKYTEARRL